MSRPSRCGRVSDDRQAVRGGDDIALGVKAEPGLLLDDEAAAVTDPHERFGWCRFHISHQKPSFGFRVVRPGQRFARAQSGRFILWEVTIGLALCADAGKAMTLSAAVPMSQPR